MLEDVRRDFTPLDKLKGFIRSKKSTKSILTTFEIQNQTENNCAVVLFTSGTESMPKGVPLTYRNILSNQRDGLKVIEVFSDDVFFGILPPFHAFGFTVTGLLPLLCGLKVAYFPDPTDGKRLAKGLEKWSVTVACGAPTFLKGMLKSATPEQVKTLRYCASGAEKAPPELYQLMANLGKEGMLHEGYGITECSPILTANRIGEPKIGVGKPMPSVELCIVHPETHAILPQGEQGLILARGPNVFNGYLNPGLASPFVTVGGKEWYQTGDLGFLDPDQNLMISGRLKRFIKVGAEMVSLAAIEDVLLEEALRKHGTVAEEGPTLAVCAKEEDGQRTRIFLFSKFPTEVDDVNKVLREAGFSNIIRVSSVFHLTEIPIMGSGKINYRELETRYLKKNSEALA
jgi:long-chain-fatty-acid--[acyl-carrier-protein] ligase